MIQNPSKSPKITQNHSQMITNALKYPIKAEKSHKNTKIQEKMPKIAKIQHFSKFMAQIGDFGHLKNRPEIGSKSSKIGPNFDFLTFLVTLR